MSACSIVPTVTRTVTVTPLTTPQPTLKSFFIEGDDGQTSGFYTIHLDSGVKLEAIGLYSDGSENYVLPDWTSSDTSVASVSTVIFSVSASGVEKTEGDVEAESVGTVTIEAYMPGINSTQLVQVTVIP